MIHLFKGMTTIDDGSETSYVPFIDVETATVGLRVTRHEAGGARVQYLYLNPSGGSDDGVPTVFVYRGESTDPALASPLAHFDLT